MELQAANGPHVVDVAFNRRLQYRLFSDGPAPESSLLPHPAKRAYAYRQRGPLRHRLYVAAAGVATRVSWVNVLIRVRKPEDAGSCQRRCDRRRRRRPCKTDVILYRKNEFFLHIDGILHRYLVRYR